MTTTPIGYIILFNEGYIISATSKAAPMDPRAESEDIPSTISWNKKYVPWLCMKKEDGQPKNKVYMLTLAPLGKAFKPMSNSIVFCRTMSTDMAWKIR